MISRILILTTVVILFFLSLGTAFWIFASRIGRAVPMPIAVQQTAQSTPLSSKIPQDAVSVVKAYYAAVADRRIDAALSRVAFDVLIVKPKPSPCAWQVLKDLQALESQLEYSKVLSFHVENFRVDGNVVTYSLGEWLDPRVVGMNFVQPDRSEWTAIVENGEITTFTRQLDPHQNGAREHEPCADVTW